MLKFGYMSSQEVSSVWSIRDPEVMRHLTHVALGQLNDGEISPSAETRAEYAARYLIRLQFGVREAERQDRFEQDAALNFGEISTIVGLESTLGVTGDAPEAELEATAFGQAIDDMNLAIESIYDGLRA
jgi:phage protein D